MEIEKLDLPAARDLQPGERAEPPQIKGPVEVPERKKEEVQLDRPQAGKHTHPVLLNRTDEAWLVTVFVTVSRYGRAGRGSPSPRAPHPSR